MSVVAAEAAEILPRWDLGDLYAGPDDPKIAADLAVAEEQATAFRARYQGDLSTLSGAALGGAITAYERVEEALGLAAAYASLLYSAAITDPDTGRFYQSIMERVTAISARLIFFTLELNRLDDDRLNELLAAPELARYAPWLRDVRSFRPYQLGDDVEELLHDKRVVGAAAWIRLYDDLMAKLRIRLDGGEATLAETLDRFYAADRSARASAAEALAGALQAVTPTVGLIMNTLVKDKEIEDRRRGFAQPISSRNLSNAVEDDVVEALLEAVKSSYGRLSHRYYRLKASWLGVERLEYWDRLAPLPDSAEHSISWPKAKDIVLDSYHRFSPRLADIGHRFFKGNWIDAAPDAAKSSGAFAHSTVPGAHPYILLNYMGRPRDVMTIAHELGHGIHQVLAAEQGMLMASTPLTLAETASLFGEMLTFKSLVAGAPDQGQKRELLAGKVEGMLGSAVRQIAFADFEIRLHAERQGGELGADRIGQIWMETQQESLGPSVHLAPGYEAYWTYVQHFIHSPFYVYAYAFGDCLVNSLYAVYEDAADGFVERYLDLLAAGGTKRHQELLRPFGLNAADPKFWQKGLDVISGLIDSLEALA